MRFFSILCCLIVCLIPCISFAATPTSTIFDVPPTDKSMEYLGMIFGTVGSLPIVSSGNPVFSQLIYIFNTIVFALGIIIIVVTSVIGTMNTAQEGETLGKKWSSIWIPARSGIGMYLLLPSVGGFNWIQVIVLWLIIQGVGAANALWKQVIISNETQGSLVADTRNLDLNNGMATVKSIFTSTVCMNKINQMILSTPSVADNLKNEFVGVFPSADGTTINFGRASDPAGKPLCGAITVPSIGKSPLPGSDPVDLQRRQMLADAIVTAQNAMEPSSNEALTQPRSNWMLSSTWVSAARALKSSVLALKDTFGTTDDVNKRAIADGWIHAGSYYFQLVQTGSVANLDITVRFTPQAMDETTLTQLLGASTAAPIIKQINDATSQYVDYINTDPSLKVFAPSESAGGEMAIIQVKKSNSGGQISNVMDAIFGGTFFSKAAADFGKIISSGCLSSSKDPSKQKGDPLICMASFGSQLTSTTEAVFWIALISVFAIWIGAATMSCMQPAGHVLNYLLSIIIPIASVMIMLIWSSGIALALYVPLIPFLVFTFATLTWIILVIEAMVGAPLIGLTLVVPSEDEIGKAGHAIVILFGLFLRPALMILGFIFAQKLLMVAVGMLNFGFASTVAMTVQGGVGMFGFVTLLVLYTGIAVTLVHEAFSLIYLLPDKTLRWMGIAGEGSDAGAQTKEMEGSMEKGAGIGKGMMKGAMGVAAKKHEEKKAK